MEASELREGEMGVDSGDGAALYRGRQVDEGRRDQYQ